MEITYSSTPRVINPARRVIILLAIAAGFSYLCWQYIKITDKKNESRDLRKGFDSGSNA